MERLPYIDQHARRIMAERTSTWDALLRTMFKDPDRLGGGWFPEVAATAPSQLTLRGAHWAATYRLTVDLLEISATETMLIAHSWGSFPGLRGAVYRALVVGSGGHALTVKLLLRQIARRAQATATMR